jgi:4-amino-4-deoxy-L-arabinose transferase-like glycosyltransferase
VKWASSGGVPLRSPWRAQRWLGEAIAVLLITLLAGGLRFYRLTEVPPGLHFDEGFKGVTARALLAGAPPRLFFESDMGEEPMAMYLVAAALSLVGQEPWVVRLPSAIVGTLTVPLAWWLGRELYALACPPRDRERLPGQIVGLGAALVLAILYWHLSFSRIGMEPILVPFFATLAFAALAHGLNLSNSPKSPYLSFALAGLALGGSLYTYKAGYFVPLVAALFVVYAALAERGFLRRHGRGLLLAALVTLLVTLPIGIYFATHPQNFLQRPASVALMGDGSAPQGPWQATVENLPRVLGMFFLQGDTNPRSNLPGRPALDPFLAFLFLIGLGRALIGFRRPAFALPSIWLGVMILPTLITEYAPHFGRAIGATPALAYLCALGAGYLILGMGSWQWLRARMPRSKELSKNNSQALSAKNGHNVRSYLRTKPKSAIAVLLGIGLLFSGLSTARAYFHTWGQSPDLFYAYDVGLAEVAGYINTLPADEDVYLTPTAYDHFSLEFLVRRPGNETATALWTSFDGRAGSVWPAPGQAATIVVLLGEDERTFPVLQQARPDGRVTWTLADSYDRPYALAYRLPASDEPAPQPEHVAHATLGDTARLLGYSLDATQVAPGNALHLTLYWQVLAPMDDEYTVFTHLLGEHNPTTHSLLWAGHDSQPDGGHYPTTAWQPGQVVLDVHPLIVPTDAPPGAYQLKAGLYLLETMTRLPATDAVGNPLPDNAVLLGTVQVEK